MSGPRRIAHALCIAICLSLCASPAAAAVPGVINYQGILTDPQGDPIAVPVSVVFTIYDAPTAGAILWTETRTITPDPEGRFSLLLGLSEPIADSVFKTPPCWLGAKVTTDPELVPRTLLSSVPFTYRVATVDGATGGEVIGEITVLTDGTGAGTGVRDPGGNLSDFTATAAVFTDSVGDRTVSYGIDGITITDNLSVNKDALVDTVFSVDAGAQAMTLGRGSKSTSGGAVALGDSCVVAATYATVAGGRKNSVSGGNAAYGFIGGGRDNVITNTDGSGGAVIGGGIGNQALYSSAAVLGGASNTAGDLGSSVVGGLNNIAGGGTAAVLGGSFNAATGYGAAVLGGINDTASGFYSTAAGGSENVAAGDYSLAAGRQAKARHSGSLVWADATGSEFASSASNQVVIRAAGGVGIGTNAPEGALHVFKGSAGLATANVNSVAVFESGSSGWLSLVGPDNFERGLLFTEPGAAIAGAIVFDEGGSGNDIGFRTGGNVTRMTLDAAGNLNVTGNITGATCCAPSDARFKQSVDEIENPLELVGRLRGVRYQWRRAEFADRHFADGNQVGLIAQEVREVLPEVVVADNQGYLAVDYARLVPLLIEGMKAQQKRIDALESRLRQIEE